MKPSSLSSSSAGWPLSISSSESSTTTFLRVAALREGRVGDVEAIVLPRGDQLSTRKVAIVYIVTVYRPALPALAPDMVTTKSEGRILVLYLNLNSPLLD